ncbi:PREDICTED: protein FANTASTIC FOUR 1-like [Nicotiana attenuata]|uniref:Protein fantastic four 4 n=1 Tax=Nicotiana attenuata TaxID=49451 RepID=A0A314KZ85_NICAT|nr:PREDICTED: protein FANTASTIC FOUR 1-like [Nicotiana attenuata]OIT34079.1 protein fantastic four 4 [Nicotiana attenuata]
MSPSISNFSPQELIEENENVSNWSFMQILNNSHSYQKNRADTEEEIYVHPSTKQSSSSSSSSSSIMNTRSLEMCTEILGSETGNNYISESNMDEFFSDISRGVQRSKCREFKKRIKRIVTFPPPLTSINGMDKVQVRSSREGGHLVLRAVSISTCSPYFHAERGTLRLSWLIDSNNNEMEVEQDAEVQNGEEAEAEAEAEAKVIEHENGDDYWPKNGRRRLAKRCKESGSRNKGIQNWGQFLGGQFLKDLRLCALTL